MLAHNTRSPMQMIIGGFLSILALSTVWPSCSHALESDSDGAHVRLLHWSHPESPAHVPGRTLTEHYKYAAQRSRERAMFLANRHLGAAAASSNTSVFVSPVNNLPNEGEYGMEITIGTPPRTMSGIADTGSDLVWVQCSPCSNCDKQPDPLFNPNNSSTYATVSCSDSLCPPIEQACNNSTCQYQYGYGDGSFTVGDLSRETVTLNTTTGGTTTVEKFAFGCGHTTSGDFSNTDGLVGLGQGPLSLTSQLGSLFGNKFSYCLVSGDDSASKTSPLLFGNSSVPTSEYSPILPNSANPTFYYIALVGVKVDGEPLNVSSGAFAIAPDGSGGVIIDSGTTITSLTDDAYTPLVSAVQSAVTYPVVQTSSFDLCFNLSGVANPKLPIITMVFESVQQNHTVDLDLPQENSFVTVDDQNTTCLAYSGAGVGGFSVFGNVQQQNVQFVYDREAGQLGFAKVQCDTISLG